MNKQRILFGGVLIILSSLSSVYACDDRNLTLDERITEEVKKGIIFSPSL